LKETVSIFATPELLALAAAEAFANVVRESVDAKGRCTIALAGGSTPRALCAILASSYKHRIPWDQVHLFWGDERFVPPDDASSNYGMTRKTLLDHIEIPKTNIHPISTDAATADMASSEFDRELHRFWNSALPTFDLIFLGLGLDGHTASLFPGTAEIVTTDIWAIHTISPIEPRDRISLTLPVINNSARVYFLIEGVEKAGVVKRLFDDKKTDSGARIPASKVSAKTELRYFLDEAAWSHTK
jgi:6-phosphogluconolactonase